MSASRPCPKTGGAVENRAGRGGMAESWAAKAHEFEAEAEVIRDSIRRTDEIKPHASPPNRDRRQILRENVGLTQFNHS